MAITRLEESLSHIEMRTFYKAICPRIVARDAYVGNMIVLREICECLDKRSPVVGYYFK